MGNYWLFSERSLDLRNEKKKHILDNLFYKSLNKREKNSNEIIDNINSIVDALLAKKNFISNKKKHTIYRGNSFIDSVFGMSDLISVKKLFAIVIFFVLLFAVIASATSFVDSDITSDTFTSDTSEFFYSNNSTSQINDMYNDSSGNVTSFNNMSSEPNSNLTIPSNYSIPSSNFTNYNESQNETVVFSGLNLSIWLDKNVYFVNESVFISGNVMFNNSLINTSVNLSINGSFYNLSINLDVINGRFNYEFIPNVDCNLIITAEVSYFNESVKKDIGFVVLNLPDENVSLNITDLHVWDDTDNNEIFAGDQVTFYTNYSCKNVSIINATSFISFELGNWTTFEPMVFIDGIFEYSRSFDTAGSYRYQISCSAFGFENKTAIDMFFISEVKNESNEISIYDSIEKEQVYVVPGTSFYIERTINGPDNLSAVFAPLFSEGLTIERIEIIKRDNSGKKIIDINKDNSPNKYAAGKGKNAIEKKIDNLLNRLPASVKKLNIVSYSKEFTLNSPITVRVWFKTPSWEEIRTGLAPSSGKISYLTFSDDSFDFESSTWWNSNWGKRKLITINSSQIEEDLTNFPVLINITDSDLANYAQDDGDDIAFILYSDNSTKLNHEIELFNGATGNLVSWVNITSLSSSVDTMIWMFYNNSACSSQQNVEGTWNDDYIMIQHLNETTGTHLDSTSNNNDDTSKSVNIQGSAIGHIDGADDFDDTNTNYVTFTTSGLTTSAGTVSLWGNMDSSTGTRSYFFSHRTGSNNNRIYIYEQSGTLYVGFADVFQNNIGYTITPDEWHLYTLAWSGASWNIYVDSNYEGGSSSATLTGIDTNCHLASYVASQEWFDGIIDEIHVSNIARNTSWINTSYNTMINMTTFISIGSAENITNTSVDTISPYNITYSPLTITATGADGLDNVTLWYRYSSDNSSWDDWIQNVTDTISPWSWIFSFSNGSGYYEFYSIGNISGFSDESAPSSADAICYFNSSVNTPPTIELINPSPNGTTGISTLPLCQIWANDSDSSTLDVYWFENSTGSYILRNTNSSISANTTVSYTFSEFSNYYTSYWWKVTVNDSEDNISAIYYFTTISIDTSVDTVSPYIVTSSPLSLSASGPSDLDEVTLFYRWSDDNVSWGHGGETVYDTPEIDSFATETENAGTTSMSWSHTVGSGLSNSVLVVGVNLEDDDAGNNYFVASADFNGDALVLAERVAADEGFSAISEIWYLLSPDAGSHTITVNFSVAINNAFGGSVSFSNVSQSVPDDIGNSFDIGTPSGISTGVTSVSPNSLIVAVSTDGNAGFTYSYGSAEIEIYNIDGTTHHGVGTYRIPSSSGSYTMYANLSGGTNRMSQAVAVWSPSSTVWGNGSDWMVWGNGSNPDSGYPWGWGFDFPNSTGYYEFYSVGNRSGSPDEVAPGSADAICYLMENLTIEINPSQWNPGTITIGSFVNTTGNFFKLSNNGTISLDIQIKASNATNITTGAQWNLTSIPGFNNYSLQYNKTADVSWTNINLTYDTFLTNLAINSWENFDIKLIMATTSTKGDPLTITVTFRSIAS